MNAMRLPPARILRASPPRRRQRSRSLSISLAARGELPSSRVRACWIDRQCSIRESRTCAASGDRCRRPVRRFRPFEPRRAGCAESNAPPISRRAGTCGQDAHAYRRQGGGRGCTTAECGNAPRRPILISVAGPRTTPMRRQFGNATRMLSLSAMACARCMVGVV